MEFQKEFNLSRHQEFRQPLKAFFHRFCFHALFQYTDVFFSPNDRALDKFQITKVRYTRVFIIL